VTRHLLKLVWNRKRANALIVAEILISFIVVFAVLTGAVTFASNWRQPLGFDWHDVWNVSMDIELESNPEANPQVHEATMRIMREAAAFPQVEAVAGSNVPPYAFSTEQGGAKVDGKWVTLLYDNVTDDFAKVMRMNVIRGRWFNAEDDGAQYRPVVIDRTAARALYGSEDAAVGKKITYEDPPDVERVVGVVETYRKDGEVMTPANMVFRRYAPDHKFGGVVRNLMLRVRPGTPAQFEEQLVDRLQRVAPEVTFRVRHLSQMRTEALRFRLSPLILGAVVGTFLIAMVALGLTGVLWQNVTRRTREIGLRRALGASGSKVHRQILLEVVLLATTAVIVGCILVLQLPVLGVFSLVSPSAFTAGLAGALATIYALTVLCGLYPSWLASRLQPADALRYE
jgi:putative ABC transport system permease protein